MAETILHHTGYGSAFNELRIKDDKLEKHARNLYGQQKLQVETNAYKTFSIQVPSFPLAKVYKYEENCLVLQYYKSFSPLWKVYRQSSKNDKELLVTKVLRYLDILHSNSVVPCKKEEYVRLLRQEVLDKVKARYEEIKDLFVKTPFHTVNGLRCLTFDECLQRVELYLNRFVETKENVSLCYIHGDPQFNNILCKKESQEIIFIDPRGYFGDSKLYGIEEYDTAKVIFALSGYDVFDSMGEVDLQLENECIRLPTFVLDSRFVSFYPEIHFLLCSIWLGNSHCFRENPQKALASFAYARYLTTYLLS